MCVACFDSRFQAAGIYHGAFHLGMVYTPNFWWFWGCFIVGFTVKYHHKLVPWEIPWYPHEKYPFISESYIVGDDIQMISHDLYTIKYSITCPWYPHWIPCEIAGDFPLSGHSGSEGQLSPGLQVFGVAGLVGGLRSQFSNCLMYFNLVLKKYMTRSNPQCLRGLFYITIYNPNC